MGDMRRGRQVAGENAGLLHDLAGKIDHLYLDGTTVRARYKYDVPVDQFKIPQREALVHLAVAASGGITDWRGYSDVHHIGWPYSAYRQLSTPEFESVGEAYRNSGGVKIRTPRQLHLYFHAGFETPPIPDEDVMVQYLAEDMAARRLLKILSPSEEERTSRVIDPARDVLRHRRYLDSLSGAAAPAVHHLPALEHLATLDAQAARSALSGIIGILNYSTLYPSRSDTGS